MGCLASLLLVGCAPEAGPLADRCGALVAFYLRLPAVESRVAEVGSEGGKVRIDYHSDERAGVALCSFSDSGGTLTLTAALVDENRLRDDEIAAFNASPGAGDTSGS